ncbi:MAG: hypothetical protein ABH823_00970 [bacterium]
MTDQKCFDCVQKKQCNDSLVAWIFFGIGLVATVAIRIVTVLMDIEPLYGKIAWYIGVGGFFAFFIYKYLINRSLAKIIDQEKLIQLTKEQQPLSANQYNLLSAILCNIRSEKERINYFFIFAVSGLALAIALYFDLVK